MTDLGEFTEHLEGVSPTGDAFRAKCPFCGERGFWLTVRGFNCLDCGTQGSLERLRDHLLPDTCP